MAFKIGNKVVLNDADPSATLLTNSNLDKLQINGTDVFTHDGTTITLQNVDIKDASGVDLSDLATTVNNNTTAINNNATAISNNATAISNNATAITNNATAITNNATAITNTLIDAKAYTDTRETAITTAYTSANALPPKPIRGAQAVKKRNFLIRLFFERLESLNMVNNFKFRSVRLQLISSCS